MFCSPKIWAAFLLSPLEVIDINDLVREKLKHLPSQPGVYIMRDKKGGIIYVGKAKSLKNRVRQYFHESTPASAKVEAMVANIHDFEYIITDTEFEALCLECNLIKKNRPKYNILLKDDKHYPYIKMTKGEYPKIFLTRKVENDGARYFGPYPGSSVIYDTIDIIRKIFKIQHCKRVFPRDIGKQRPCLYYSMGRCSGVCTGNISAEEYKKTFEEVLGFLEGNHKPLLKRLEEEMEEAAKNLEFERAAMIRNKIWGIRGISDRQKVIAGNLKDMDIFALVSEADLYVFKTFFVRSGKVIGSDTHKESGAAFSDDAAALSSFVMAYYNRDVAVPKNVVVALPHEDYEGLELWLSQKAGERIYIKTPVRGELRRMVEMVEKNARASLNEYKIELLKRENKSRALEELKEELGLLDLPERIEAYDISNTSGSENVGSMVVFENGKRNKDGYRRFKIKYTAGANDYECMREVLQRRFSRMSSDDKGFSEKPSLVFVDGGMAQISAALSVFNELSLDIPVFGMVKDERHKTRGLINAHGEIFLNIQSAAFRLVSHIQDEAHRFAIEYHKTLRSKKNFESDLLGISGIGPAKSRALMKHFRSMGKIKSASLEELLQVKGIDKIAAKNVYEYFKEDGK